MSITWAFSASSRVRHLGCWKSMATTSAFPTMCFSILFAFTFVSPNTAVPPTIRTTTPPVHSTLLQRTVHLSCTFHLLFLLKLSVQFLLLPSYNFHPFISNSLAVLDDVQSMYSVHFTCSSCGGFHYIVSVRLVLL
ncbi:hypothetical protein IW262DRAFT_1398114 [Armillaria fumosa]|nr:hypothetical protein IW262DRAFT_1398114 [Armillaria fumosa]